MEFKISMGCLADPIEKQVKDQGFEISEEDAKILQRYYDSILLLYVNSILNETETKSAQKKLMPKIVKALRKPKSNKEETK